MLFSSRSLTSSGKPVMNTVRTSSAAWRVQAAGRWRGQRWAATERRPATQAGGRAPRWSARRPGRSWAPGGRRRSGGPQRVAAAEAAPPAASQRACGRQRGCRWGWGVVKSGRRLDGNAVEGRGRRVCFRRLVGLQVRALHCCRRCRKLWNSWAVSSSDRGSVCMTACNFHHLHGVAGRGAALRPAIICYPVKFICNWQQPRVALCVACHRRSHALAALPAPSPRSEARDGRPSLSAACGGRLQPVHARPALGRRWAAGLRCPQCCDGV